jgi:hypothetical protein
VARLGHKRNEYLNERDHLEDLDVDVSILLKLILKKLIGRSWTEFI